MDRYSLSRSMATVLAVTLSILLLPVAAFAMPEEEPPQAALAAAATAPGPSTLPSGELHVRTHDVRVVINNGFATTTVEQVLVNPTSRDVEAA